MFYKFTLDIGQLQDNTILPESIEKSTIFYELVIKNGNDAILRIPFSYDDICEWKVELYDDDTEIQTNRIQLSMHPHIARFDKSRDIFFHVAKITKDVDTKEGPLINRIGYETHIKESTSDVQDLPFFCLSSINPAKSSLPKFLKDFVVFEKTKKLKKIDELPLHNYSFKTQYWLTQRDFYSKSHTTLSDSVHRENIQVLKDKFFDQYKNYEFSSVLEMLIRLGKAVTKGRIKYKADRMFARSGVSTDAGNISIETSSRGDCEDLNNFFMRIFRTMANVYKYFVEDQKSDLFIKCKTFADNYVPLCFICQVRLESGLEFHSTMLVIPRSIEYPVLSFEVTNPRKSYELPSNEYHSWHNEQYFLVDNYFISKINKVSVEKIEIGELKFINY